MRNFCTIRKILEDIFKAFNKHDLLPNEFVEKKIFLNESSKFLTGKDKKGVLFIEKSYKHLEETHLPEIIANSLRNVLQLTQDGSHRSKVDNHIKSVKNPYLFKSVLYQILDIIVWFKIYIDDNPKVKNWAKVENVNNLNSDEFIDGHVINLNEKGFAFFRSDNININAFISPDLVREKKLKSNMKIKAKIENSKDKEGNNKWRVKDVVIMN